MLKSFQLVAIVNEGSEWSLLRVPLHQELQETLANEWYSQYQSFTKDIHEIEFDPGYQPEMHEQFSLSFTLPEWLQENSQSVLDFDAINRGVERLERIKGIAAFVREQRRELILFQNFSRSHVIQPGRFLFLQNNTYKSVQHPALTLDWKLSAVYFADECKLLFHSFRTVNTFLPLADIYEEASTEEIQQVLSHKLLAPVDAQALADGANQWFRKRFAMLRDSGILDRYTAQDILHHSRGYEVDIQLEGNRIVFPAERSSAKRLLQFLNEEVFRGAITDTLYETNSKREADS